MRLALRGLILFTVAATCATPHAVPTHTNITRRAVEYIRDVLKLPEFCCALGLESQLQIGTAGEDNDEGNRYMFHFYPALSDSLFISWCSSLQWGFSRGSCSATVPATFFPPSFTRVNTHTYMDAALHAREPFTGRPSTRGWNDLGYILHLFEDLTSPAHTRSDAHPPYLDGDPVEAVTRNPLLPSGGLVRITSPEAAFTELKNWTQSRFYSADTVFARGLPGPAASPAASTFFYFADAAGRKIAYKGLRYWASCDVLFLLCEERAATINATIADEQWLELGPQAVLYAASVIKYYNDTESPAVNAVTNGDFESGDISGWHIGTSGTCDFPAFAGPSGPYATAVTGNSRDGQWAARLGRWDQPYRNGPSGQPVQGAEPCGYSYMYQDIDLPALSSLPTGKLWLSFDYNVQTYDTAVWSWFDAVIQDANTGAPLQMIVERAGKPGRDYGTYYDDGWKSATVDISRFAGRKIRIWFGNRQDGYGDQNATWIDKVVLCDRMP